MMFLKNRLSLRHPLLHNRTAEIGGTPRESTLEGPIGKVSLSVSHAELFNVRPQLLRVRLSHRKDIHQAILPWHAAKA